MIETKPKVKMQPWTALSSWLAHGSSGVSAFRRQLTSRRLKCQPAQNSCPRLHFSTFGLVSIMSVLGFLPSISLRPCILHVLFCLKLIFLLFRSFGRSWLYREHFCSRPFVTYSSLLPENDILLSEIGSGFGEP